MTLISKDISKAIDFLNSNDIIGFPTETVYGLAGNMYSETAVQKIFDIKQRPAFNPLIVHIKDINELYKVAQNVPQKAMDLANRFWPGPLTLLLQKNALVPDIVTAGKTTVAVRIPNHSVALSLLQQLDFPLVAPSANPFGRISPTTAKHVADYFPDKLPMVLDGGNCSHGLESTIVGFDNNDVVVYRLGAISVEDIEKIAGKTILRNKNEKSPEAPGMIGKHYAPKTKTVFMDRKYVNFDEFEAENIGVLSFSKVYVHKKIKHHEVLSTEGDLNEAAQNLYQALHRLDNQNLDLIVVEKFEDKELGRSINDRLKRATT